MNWLRCFFVALSILTLCGTANADDRSEKLCWAHYVGWGHSFNTWTNSYIRFYDRPLLGKWVGTDTGLYSTTRTQILSALQYGIDGFCVDVPVPANYGAMGRLYDAADGLPFKIALCVDGWRGSVDSVVEHMALFLDRWGNHPNNAYIDGRPVIFIYKAASSIDKSKAIVEGLKARGYNPYWLIQAQRETAMWDNKKHLRGCLDIFDGFYDFGCNGFSKKQMTQRLRNARNALDAAKSDGILVAGISRGYARINNGFTRPAQHTQTMRDNWAAAMDVDADWVCLCTWNDYAETTHFEPSLWARDTQLLLNQDFVRQWRGDSFIQRSPRVTVSYMDEVLLGNDWTVEVAWLPYSTPASTCHIKITDFVGNEIKVFDPIALTTDCNDAKRLRLDAPGIETPRHLLVWGAIQKDADADIKWKQFAPVVIRPGFTRHPRTVYFPLYTTSLRGAASVVYDASRQTLLGDFKAWQWVGKAELLRNGYAVAELPIVKNGGAKTAVTFSLADVPQEMPEDVMIIRFTREDGKVLFSKPLVRRQVANSGVINFPAVVRGATFDEGWFDRIWNPARPWRLDKREVVMTEVRASEVFSCSIPMSTTNSPVLDTEGGWNLRVIEGGHTFGGSMVKSRPVCRETVGPAGMSRLTLDFDGSNDFVALPSRTLPHNVMTVELWCKPCQVGQLQYVFSDQNCGMDIGFDETGHPFAERIGTRVTAPSAIASNTWVHVGAVLHPETLDLFVNAVKVGEVPVAMNFKDINSRPMIGGMCREQGMSHYFEGQMAGVSLTACPLEPWSFKLLCGEKCFVDDFNSALSAVKWSRLDTAFSVADGVITMTETAPWSVNDYIMSTPAVSVFAATDENPVEVGIDVVSNVWNSTHSGENYFSLYLLDESACVVAGIDWSFQEDGVAYGLKIKAGGNTVNYGLSPNWGFVGSRMGFRVTDEGVWLLKNGVFFENKFLAFPVDYSLPSEKLSVKLMFRGPHVGAKLMLDDLEVIGPSSYAVPFSSSNSISMDKQK